MMRADTSPEGVNVGPAVRSSETGTFVAVDNVWSGYEDQDFLRSEDGVTWEILGPDAFDGGHNIFSIAFGFAEPSDVCPS